MTTLRVNDKYEIEVPDDNEVFGITIALTYKRAVLKHPNILMAGSHIFEFKHYSSSSGKFWTRVPGVDYLIAVPREAIEFLLEETYSYPRFKVGEATITGSTSGWSTESGGWVDYVFPFLATLVNTKAKDVKALLAASLPPDDPRVLRAGRRIPAKNAAHDEEWVRLTASHTVPPQLKKGMIIRTQGCSADNLVFEYKTTRGRKRLCCRGKHGEAYSASPRVVDWVRTALDNKLKLPAPIHVTRLTEVHNVKPDDVTVLHAADADGTCY